MLEYIAVGYIGEDALVRTISESVVRANADAAWRAEGVNMLTYIEDARIQAEIREKRGREEGLREGFEQGIEQGLEQGLEQGRQEGEKRFQTLMQALYETGRADEAQAAVMDAARREELYRELGV